MKRMLHSGALLLFFSLYAGMLQAQLEEDFTPHPANWILANGYSFKTVNGTNEVVVSPNGNSDPVVGTPIVTKSSNTVTFSFDFWGYDNGSLVTLPCASTVDLYFVDPSVNNSNDLNNAANIFGSVTGLSVGAGGRITNSFTFPAAVTATQFRVFVAVNPGCDFGSTKMAFDNFTITGLSEVCTGSGCPPVALPDIFSVGLLPTTAVLYGDNPAYPTVPGAQVYANGDDNDPNDAFGTLHWTLESGPSLAGISVVISELTGTAVITRTDPNVSGVATFVYKLTDNDGNSDTALVTLILGAGAPLPVELVSFTGSRNNSAVNLKWTTASESGSAGFEVQRLINNEYKPIGYVASKASNGTSNSPITYQFGETFSSTNVAWYRLVQVNMDGTKKILPAVAVRGLEDLKKALIYPNPGSTINVLFGSSSIRDISISDLSGKLVKRWNDYRDDNLTVNGLQTGMYLLLIYDKNTSGKTIHKILINR
jgi:hypothetical protein